MTTSHKDYFEKLEYGDKLLVATQNGNASCFAYRRLDTYLLAATIQMKRIWQDAEDVKSKMPDQSKLREFTDQSSFRKKVSELYAPLFVDIHFYFSSWDNAGKMMKVLSKQPELAAAKLVYEKHWPHINHFSNGRHTFEHFHDRLPGEKDEHRVKEVIQSPGAGPSKIYGGVTKDGFYVHSDGRWDIKPTSLELLLNIAAEFKSAVHSAVDSLLNSKFLSQSS